MYHPTASELAVADGPDHETRLADARLRACAPDLLHALYTALPFVEDAADDECYKSHRVHAILKEIRAVLDRATTKD